MRGEAIKLAIEKGGYRNGIRYFPEEGESEENAVLDPKFWQALGKALGWGKTVRYLYQPMLYSSGYPLPDGDGDSEWRSSGEWVTAEEKREIIKRAKTLKEGQDGYDPQFKADKSKDWLEYAKDYFYLVLTGGDTEKFLKDLLPLSLS